MRPEIETQDKIRMPTGCMGGGRGAPGDKKKLRAGGEWIYARMKNKTGSREPNQCAQQLRAALVNTATNTN
jgi:hypothetical protein